MIRARSGLAAGLTVLAIAACGGSGGEPDSVTLVVYDSYPADSDPPNPLQVALAEFTDATGIDVTVLQSQDAGTMLSKAALTAGNPEGDVMWGVDNTLLSRAIEADVFEPYEAERLDALDPALTALVPGHEATPVDFGDVCVNYDIAALADAGIEPPTSFEQLAEPEYASRLVVQNPATSSPGLAFLLATIAEFGDDGWQAFWEQLDANGVAIVDSWSDAYYTAFTRAGGDRPLVVSYGSSPPFEVLFADTPLDTAPTGVVEETCFRQVEFAGVLRGTKAPDAARRLVDFLISERFQRELALNLFVFPVNPAVELQPEFIEHATIPSDPLTLDPARIEAERSTWIDAWTTIVGA
jgi:thiamine transport system substrate-binding protein